ncbi:hypothetical protein ABVK25_001942 [Lepraria finkii]|uniref:Uncharacterized protein n=1 Tax=Lepraria finkii TaxID=1340010 RepID=A0ABR4BIS8_9LECA
MSLLRKNQPRRKLSTRYTTKPPAGLPEFEMLQPPGKTNGFVIQVTEHAEGRPSTSESIRPSFEAAPTTETPSPRQKPQPPPLALAIPQKAHISQNQIIPPPPSSPPPSIRSRAPSPADIPLPRSSTNTPELICRSNNPTPTVVSPVMRSMFPKYDPSRPLNRQSYHPNIEAVPGLASAMAVSGSSNNPYRHQIARRSMLRTSIEMERNETPDVKETPLRMVENAERQAELSTPEELLELWNISNGQAASEDAPSTYNLELSCDDLTFGREVITFNSSTSDPNYTLEASHSNITISRVHPVNHTPVIQICGSVLSQPTAVDPLVTWVFPKLAGLMALDQSSNVAVAHKLDRTASAELQNEAIQRAQEQEASMLLWDDSSNKYCLMHPTLLDSAATTLPITIIPHSSSPQKITIYAPETHEPLLELSIQTLNLTIHASTITALPSLYILDSLMTSLLTLLLHLHRSCATPTVTQPATFEQTPMFPPPPTLAHMDSPIVTAPKTRKFPLLSLPIHKICQISEVSPVHALSFGARPGHRNAIFASHAQVSRGSRHQAWRPETNILNR